MAGKTIATVATGRVSLAVASDGTVYAWGDNSYGQLGNGSSTSSPVPVAVTMSGALAGKQIVKVAVGSTHCLALASDGTVYSWGINYRGELGLVSTQSSSAVPLAVTTAGTPMAGKTITDIAAGGRDFSVALASDGTVYSWGSNDWGQLGYGALITQSYVPVAVTTSGTPMAGKTITAVAAGYAHTVALASDGTVFTWGTHVGTSFVPVAVATAGTPMAGKTITAIGAGLVYSAALASDGTLFTWGGDAYPRLGLGYGGDGNFNVPQVVPPSMALEPAPEVVALAASGAVSIAVTADGARVGQSGTVHRWGKDMRFPFFQGNDQLLPTPWFYDLAGYPVTAVSLGGYSGAPNSLLRQNGGSLVEWGSGSAAIGLGGGGGGGLFGSFGSTNTIPAGSRFLYGDMLSKTFTAVASGEGNNVALASDGTVYAWGWNEYGQVGNGSEEPVIDFPIQILSGVQAISAVGTLGVALKSDGKVWAWGGYSYGASSPSQKTLGALATGTFTAVASGGPGGFYALSNEGKVYNSSGELVGGALTGKTVTAISAGPGHAVALDAEGRVYAWGSNGAGQLGNNSTADSSEPVAVNVERGTSALYRHKVVGLASTQGDAHTLVLAQPLQPLITGAAGPASGTFEAGTYTFTVTLTFDDGITVTGTPRLALAFGAATRYATYAGGSGTNTLTFRYVTQGGDAATGITVASPVQLAGGSLTGSNAAAAVLTFTPPDTAGVQVVDTTPPTITSAMTASGTYGAAFNYTVTASETIASYSATALPAGLSIDTATGALGGTPGAVGEFTVMLGATDSAGNTGSASLTLTIAKATATVTLGSLSATYDGSAKSATATTNPGGLSVNFTYNGGPTAPSAVGSYAVIGTVVEANYQGSASGTLMINPDPVGTLLDLKVQIILNAQGTPEVSFETQAGASYIIQHSTDLKTWRDLSNVTGTGQKYTYKATKAAPAEFFRVGSFK
jgi:alpha-tubulin suppressor-like RCC1 family protein